MSRFAIQRLLQKGGRILFCQVPHFSPNGICQKKNCSQVFQTSFKGFHSSQRILTKVSYTESHEWVKVDGQIGTIGITDFAQEKLGDIVFCELPDVGVAYDKGESFSTVESVKAASDLYIPLSGEIIERNERLAESPSLINESPFNEGWLVKIKLGGSADSEVSELLSEDEYEKVKSSESDD